MAAVAAAATGAAPAQQATGEIAPQPSAPAPGKAAAARPNPPTEPDPNVLYMFRELREASSR